MQILASAKIQDEICTVPASHIGALVQCVKGKCIIFAMLMIKIMEGMILRLVAGYVDDGK